MQVHDFADRALGEHAKAIPCGIYDVSQRRGWVSVDDAADTAETGLRITVCHYPPGTSKWGPIEHRPFSFITSKAVIYLARAP